MYFLGYINELQDGNKTIIGFDTYFSVLIQNDIIIVNGIDYTVDTISTDEKFSVTTSVIGSVNDKIYTPKKSKFYEYKLWETEIKIANYDTDLVGVKRAESGNKKIELSDSNTTLQELIRLRNYYESEYQKALDSENGTSVWIMRRAEYGTR